FGRWANLRRPTRLGRQGNVFYSVDTCRAVVGPTYAALPRPNRRIVRHPMPSPIAANIVNAAAFADELARFRVVEPARLNELLRRFTGTGPLAMAEYLLRQGALTAFQAERALAGESRMLALGQYRVTGLAGIGTFGPLFTAVHTSKPGLYAV